MNLTGQIESAELQFKQLLEDFFISIYDERSLPSHGIDHHRRVWRNAKELLKIFPFRNSDSALLLPSKLIITCYLHDVGMAVDQGIRHGQFSKELCTTFLKENRLSEEDYYDVLETIENHDLKNYSEDESFNELHTILSAADDLDAFGFTGIYRYAEIYHLRGVKPGQTGKLIKENSAKRFEHFTRTFGENCTQVSQQRIRYKILDDFFTMYNSEVASSRSDSLDSTGYSGVIKLITSMIKERKELKELFRKTEKFNNDPVIKWFLEGLQAELKE